MKRPNSALWKSSSNIINIKNNQSVFPSSNIQSNIQDNRQSQVFSSDSFFFF